MAVFQSYANESFWKCYNDLPKEIQELANKSYNIFKENPSHPGLQFKKVGKKQPVYSARVSDYYRALCMMEGDSVYWFWIGNHDSYMKLINNL